jgi:hypothetical protein
VYLLGPPLIERDGVPVKVDTSKAIALLAYEDEAALIRRFLGVVENGLTMYGGQGAKRIKRTSCFERLLAGSPRALTRPT